MATIRAYTTIEQSRKLAEILPLESADMCYRYYSGGVITGYGDCVLAKSFITRKNVIRENDLPCWSLAALLSLMICPRLENYVKGIWDLTAFTNETLKTPIEIQDSKDPIDACVKMILKLHELNLL